MKKFYFLFLMMLLPLMASADVCALQNEEKEPYAVLSADNTVLTFYYDDQKAARNGMDVGPFTRDSQGNVNSGWDEQRESITNVVFEESFANCTTLTSTVCWFYNFQNLSSITGISNLKTDNVTNMDYMFYSCSSLTSLDVRGFKTDNVTSMCAMFLDCSSLTSLDVTGFKTDNVTDMASMFWGCSGLTSLDVTGFKTDNVTNMHGMFAGCSSLTSLNVTGFKTDNVTNMDYMFYSCSSLTSLDVTGFKTNNVTDMGFMFADCSGLTSLDLSGFKTNNVTIMNGMFYNCSSLTTIYAGDGWSTAKVWKHGDMFYGCTSLVGGAGTPFHEIFTNRDLAHIDGGASNPGYFTATDVAKPYAVLSDNNTVLTFYYDDQKAARNGMDVGPFTISYDKDRQRYIVNSGWDEQRESITNVVFEESFANCTTLTSTVCWFYNFQNLSSITGISNLKTDNVTDMNGMFHDCSGLTSLDVTGFKTDNVTNMSGMFSGCHSLTSLDVTGFKTDNVTDMASMFWGCSGLTSLDVTGFKTDNVTNMLGMFAYCSSLTSLNVTGFKTDNVTVMGLMFSGCSGLTSLDVTGFKTDKVTDMGDMFFGCSGLTSLDVTGFKTDNVTNMSYMFWGCSGLTSLDVTGFKTDNVMFMGWMFSGCSGLKTIYAGEGWSTAKVTAGKDMFAGCTSLVGGTGTRYDESHTDHTYARIDGGASNPGYFTKKSTTDKEDVDEITIKEIGKTTWCSEYDLDFTNVAGIKAYTATGYNNITKTIWLTRVMEVPAGTGLLVKGDPGTYKIPHAEVQSYYVNMLVGNLGATISIAATDGDKTNYYLSGKDGSFVSVNGSANIGKNKAYLQLPTSIFAGTRSIGISYDDEDGTTDIREAKQSREDGAYYTLQGQRVMNPGKGLYIHKGKKVVIK